MNKFAQRLLPFSSLLFLVSLWTFLMPDTFLTLANFRNVLGSASASGIIAAGMTFVIVTAVIDLSVGSMLALCGMAGAAAMLALWLLSGSFAPAAEVFEGAALWIVLVAAAAAFFAYDFALGQLILYYLRNIAGRTK